MDLTKKEGTQLKQKLAPMTIYGFKEHYYHLYGLELLFLDSARNDILFLIWVN